jgi:hypothetical protein
MKIQKFHINNINIREEFIKYLDNKLKEEFCGNDFEKRIKILKSDSTTKNLLNDNNENQSGRNLDLSSFNIINQPYYYLLNNYGLNNTSLGSTVFNSEINNNSSSSIIRELLDKQFNLARTNFCLKHKLYDIPLTSELENFNHPVKYQINNAYYSYVYSNELITFCITVSGFIFKSNMLNNSQIKKEYKGSKFNQVLGLYMCGKEIKLNENITKKCAPNEFICKDCIKLNKEIYNLKDNYLINIFGRVAKKNKGAYHCFGHFLVNDKIEECITSYTCNACSFLNSFYNYYQN